jgi:hypothetical protein
MRVLAAIALALAGCSAAPLEAPKADNLIVPGQRIGQAALGMSAKALIDSLGAPRESTKLPERTVNEFRDGITVVVRDSDLRVISIGTADAWYTTPEGIRAGSTELEVRAQLAGTPQVVEDKRNARIKTLCYPGMEIDFWPQQRGVAAVRVTNLPCLKPF